MGEDSKSGRSEGSLAVQGPVLLTGALGQLGLALQELCPTELQLHAFSRSQLDIADSDSVETAFSRTKPALVINAAAYAAVDRAESEPEAAYRANALGPQVLAERCAANGTRLIHVSTDFVFDGSASRPYRADAATAPLSVYGLSKLQGEEAVAAGLEDHVILRTGWVYSHRGSNFFRTMLRLHAERAQLTVVADQVGTPTRAESLARAIWAIACRPALRGIYHWSDAGVCSWYDFAVAIGRQAAKKGLVEQAAEVIPINSEDYPTPASRPHYSVLDKNRTWDELAMSSHHWQEELAQAIGRALADQNSSNEQGRTAEEHG
ncbi:MAG: dTDP-4-dehydrorhamnose reductase [Pseudomonadota bacterium]